MVTRLDLQRQAGSMTPWAWRAWAGKILIYMGLTALARWFSW